MKACSAPLVSALPASSGSLAAVSSAPASEPWAVSRSLGVRVEVRLFSVEEYFDAARLPSTATPSAAPSSREALFMAEPAPARRVGTDDMMAAVIGDIARDMPAAIGV